MYSWKALNVWLISQNVVSNNSIRKFWDNLKVQNALISALEGNNVYNWRGLLNEIKGQIWRFNNRSFVNIYRLLERYPMFKGEAHRLYTYLLSQKMHILVGGSVFEYFPGIASLKDPPYVLFVLGNLEYLSQDIESYIGIVGTRSVSLGYYRKSKLLLEQLSKIGAKIVTVSGYAKGIDRLVFNVAKKYRQAHIAVLPVFSKSKVFGIKKIEWDNSIFVSEYFRVNNNIQNWEFVRRNRIIAALSDFILIMQAPVKSGACITAHFAASMDRDVYVLLNEVKSNIGGVSLVLDKQIARFFTRLDHIFRFEKDSIYIKILNSYKQSIKGVLVELNIDFNDDPHLEYFIELFNQYYLEAIPILIKGFKINKDALPNIVLKLVQRGIIYKEGKVYVFNIKNLVK